jgi:DNA-binding SARP family transcriptional activator
LHCTAVSSPHRFCGSFADQEIGMLRLFLFGAPRIEQGGQTVPLRRTKALALLAYLVTTGWPQERDALLALLWPEFDAASGRNNLRRELSLLKTTLGEEFLIADRATVAWNAEADAWLDVAVFQAQIAIGKQHDHPPGGLCAACAPALALAARLHTDDFMAGFSLPDSSAFDEWQFFQREGLRRQLAEALGSLAHWHRERAAAPICRGASARVGGLSGAGRRAPHPVLRRAGRARPRRATWAATAGLAHTAHGRSR